MSRFDASKQHKTAIDWSVIAYQAADDDKAAQTLVIGAVIGLGIASVTTPLLGGVIGAYFVIKGIQKACDADKNKKYIKDAGCVAHVLENGNFRAYLLQNGKDKVLEELQFAEQEGLSFSDDALDFYEDYLESTPQALPEQKVNTPNQEQLVQTQTQSQSQIQSKVNVYDPINTIDILGELTNTITNTAIIAVPRSGKGVLISNAIREAKRKHPQLKIFVIDPKNDAKEYSFYEGIADKIERRSCIDASPSSVAEWAKESFRKYVEFANQNQKTLLIVEDGSLIGGKLNTANSTLFIDKISSWASGADSLGRNVWFVMQSPYVGASALNLSASSQLTTVVIAWGENIGVLTQWKSAKIFNKLSLDEVSELVNVSPCKRAFYFGKTGKWYPMPELKNYSGYDRDTETYLPGFTPQLDNTTNDLDAVNQLEDSLNSEPDTSDNEPNLSNNLLSDTAQLVFDWLVKNRPKQWVKYKGSNRDQAFLNLLSKLGYGSQDKMVDELFAELLLTNNIDIDESKGTIIAL